MRERQFYDHRESKSGQCIGWQSARVQSPSVNNSTEFSLVGHGLHLFCRHICVMSIHPHHVLSHYFPFPNIPYLETERLWLRENSPQVVQRVFSELDDAAVMAFYDLPDEAALAEERQLHKKGYETVNITYRNWFLIEKSLHTIVGHIGFHTWQPKHRRAEVGYALTADSYKRKGYATEGMHAMITHGFQAMDLNRMEAFISPENTASLRLVEKFGFVKEGLLREHYHGRGRPEDSAVYGLLRADFV